MARDLAGRTTSACVRDFAEGMGTARSFLRGIGQLHKECYRPAWFLDAAAKTSW